MPFLISYSVHIDQGLYRFSNGTNQITTTHVQWDDDGKKLVLDTRSCPYKGQNDNCGYGKAMYEGVVLSPDIAPLLGELNQFHPRHLFSLRSEGDIITMASKPASMPGDVATTPSTNAQQQLTHKCRGAILSLPQVTKLNFEQDEGYLFGEPPPLSPRAHADGVTERVLVLSRASGHYVTSAVNASDVACGDQVLGSLLRSDGTQISDVTAVTPRLSAAVLKLSAVVMAKNVELKKDAIGTPRTPASGHAPPPVPPARKAK
jgi:hypothetical protein